MKLKLIYVDTPFWRAELARVTLFLGGVDFEDARIARDEFLRARESGKVDDGTVLPFHQIPCLVADGVSISQTGGIARLCGKLAGLYPVDDHLKAGIIDQFLDFATDITVMISITMKEKDDSKRIALRQKLVSGPLTKKLTMLERCIPDNSDWIVAPNLTIADIAIWRVLGWLSSGMIEGLPTHMFSNFPKIQRVCLAVDRQPKVQEWILKTYPANYVRGNY